MTTAQLRRPSRTAASAVGLLIAGCVAVVLDALPSVDVLHRLVVLFTAGAVASLFLFPRGVTVARTWVVGYLVLQFPIRVLFLLTAPKERPPLYAEVSPGVGLEPALVTAMAESCLGLAALLLAYGLARRAPRSRRPVVTATPLRVRQLGVLLAAATLLLPVEKALSSSSASANGFLLSVPGLAASGAAAAACYAAAHRPRGRLVVAGLALAYADARVELLHSKLALLSCLVAILVGFTAREHDRRAGRRLSLPGIAVGLVSLVAVLAVFAVSSGRTKGQDSTGSIYQGGEAVVSRSYGVDALVASDSYVAQDKPLLHGQSMLELATSWVPRALWPDKPKSFSIRFGEEVFSFSHGVGSEFFAPSYSGEWLLNFGPAGLLVGWVLFGIALAKIDEIPSLGHRMLWLVPAVHMVEGSIVAQLWLAAPFLLGGYAVLRAPRPGRP